MCPDANDPWSVWVSETAFARFKEEIDTAFRPRHFSITRAEPTMSACSRFEVPKDAIKRIKVRLSVHEPSILIVVR